MSSSQVPGTEHFQALLECGKDGVSRAPGLCTRTGVNQATRAAQTERVATGAPRRSREAGALWLALLSCVYLASGHPHLVVQGINVPGTFADEPVRRTGFVDVSRLYALCTLNLLEEACTAEQTLHNGIHDRYTKDACWPVYIKESTSHTPSEGCGLFSSWSTSLFSKPIL